MIQARFATGRFFTGVGRMFVGLTFTPVENVLYAVPFDQQLRIDALAIVSKPNGGQPSEGFDNCYGRLGLYECDPDTGMPSDLIEDTGDILLDSGSNGLQLGMLDSPRRLTGTEWVAAVFTGNPCQGIEAIKSVVDSSFLSLDFQQRFGGASTSSGSPMNGVIASHSFGALPEVFPAAGGSYNQIGLYVRGG